MTATYRDRGKSMKIGPTVVPIGIVGLTLALLASGVLWNWPRLQPHAAEAQTQQPPVPAGMPTYKPPQRGAPTRRVGGGPRRPGDQLPTIAVLAPDHPGLTIHEQPSLYWFLSEATTYPVEVTLIIP